MAGTHQRLIKGPGPQNGQNTNGTNNLCRDAAWVFWRKQQRLKLQWCGYMIKNGLECIENIFWRRIYEPTTGRECRKHPQNHKNHLKTGILKVIEDSRLELWEFWTRRNGYFDPSHGGVKPAGFWGEAGSMDGMLSWLTMSHWETLDIKNQEKVILG